LPRRDLAWFVSPIHCATPKAEMLAQVKALLDKQACLKDKNARLIPQCLRYAECIFDEQVALYRRVLVGNFS